MDLTSVGDDALSDFLYHARKTVAPYVRMGIDEYGRVCPKCHKLMQHFPDITFLGTSGVQFSI